VPPFEGEGESQFRVLVWVPPPHVTLQVAKGVQDPHFPSKNLVCLFNILGQKTFQIMLD